MKYFSQKTGAMNSSTLPFVLLSLLLWTTVGPVNAGNILVLHPLFTSSHVLALRHLIKELSLRGHQVTVVRPLDRRVPGFSMTNVTEITVPFVPSNHTGPLDCPNEDVCDPFSAVFKYAHERQLEGNTLYNYVRVSPKIWQLYDNHCQRLLSNAKLVTSLRDTHFDVALVDLALNECGMALVHHLGIPAIGYWALPLSGGEVDYMAAYNPLSYRPHVLTQYSSSMNFKQRVWNNVLAGVGYAAMQLTFVISSLTIQSYLPHTPYPASLLANLSGLLINTSPALEFPLQLPPTFLPVGGFHIQPPKPLPQHVEQFMSTAPLGVIVFSLGSNLTPMTAPLVTLKTFLAAFSRIPQRVVMGFRSVLPLDLLPSNVMALDWLPQADLLAHNNTSLFITHCGMHGVLEALHYGVPMIGMPMLFDQQDVLVRLVHRRAVVVLPEKPSQDDIVEAVQTAYSDPSYLAAAQQASRIMRHQPVTPKAHALWLVEHVMMTRGANHLKMTSVATMGVLQYFSLDVLALLVTLLSAVMAVIRYGPTACVVGLYTAFTVYMNRACRLITTANIASISCVTDLCKEFKVCIISLINGVWTMMIASVRWLNKHNNIKVKLS